MTLVPRQDVPLAPFTTLGLGGPARFFVEAHADDQIDEALAWATQRGLPAFVLGSGSNTLVPDAGFDGLVLRLCTRGIAVGEDLVTAAAGEPWDPLVATTVAANLGGLECLSGIPGTTGATPVQNVGAYGQEVSETIRAVRVLDRLDGRTREMTAAACAFAYRDSLFKRTPGRYVVRAVTFALSPGAPPCVRYAEVRAALPATASLGEARAAVLALRRRKSMVIDDHNLADPNRRSVGSFFTNPVLSDDQVAAVTARARAAGILAADGQPPGFPAGPGRHKLAAAWLIERAGFSKGERRGPVGLSSAHALALVHHGGGRTGDLLAFAREIRDRVQARFGVTLVPEPIVMGLDPAADPLA
jgi:UDP-N-acetylmuramate dehydrogenase